MKHAVAGLIIGALSVSICSGQTNVQQAVQRLRKHNDPKAAAALVKAKAVAPLNQQLNGKGLPAALCAWALYKLPVKGCAPKLREQAKSADQLAAYWAVRAIGRFRQAEDVAFCRSFVPKKTADYWEQARRAPDKKTVGFIGQDRRTRPAKPIFAKPHMHNVRVAYAATQALADIGGEAAGRALMDLLNVELYTIRHGAVLGLGNMKYRPAIPALRELESDPVFLVRMAASEALEKMERQSSIAPMESPALPPALIFVRKKGHTHATFGFRDSYPLGTLPWYGAGDNLFKLSPVRPDGKVTNLTGLSNGAVQGPEISFDGKTILFAMRKDRQKDGFHLFEMGVDGAGLRQLTDGNCNDVDPQYLPDGRIVFSSDRAGYREFYHQERSRVLYIMNGDGSGIRQLTFNPNQDYEPLLLSDRRILYGSYRFYAQDGSGPAVPGASPLQRIETVLRTIMTDGSSDQLFYGSMRGDFYTPIRAMPDSLQYQGWSKFGNHVGVSVSFPRELEDGRIVCMTPAGLTLLHPARGPIDCEQPIYPELLNIAGGERVYIHPHDHLNPIGRFTTPYPVGGDWVLVSHAPWYKRQHNAYGIYLFNLKTRKGQRIYDDPDWSEVDVIPVAPRKRVGLLPSLGVSEEKKTGRILCNSVFNSDLPFDRSKAKFVRVLEALYCNLSISANAGFRSRILGTVPLASDGSFFVEVPADTPLRFQVLDDRNKVLVHETAFNYVRGGETQGCIGCHEQKGASPASTRPEAMKNPPYVLGPKQGAPVYMGRFERSYNLIVRE